MRLFIGALILFGISVAINLLVASSAHFDGLYGQDPYAYYEYGGRIQSLITHGQGLGHLYYPLGYPILIAFSFFIGGVQPLSPQIVSIVCGAGVTIFAALITLEAARGLHLPDRFAVIGGLFTWGTLTISGQLIQSSIVIMSDTPALFWATFSAWALIVYGRTRHPLLIGLAAFALAGAIMTRWNYALLGLPWVVYGLLIWRFRIRWQHAALAIAVGLITLTPQIIASSTDPAALTSNAATQNWSLSNAFGRDFVTADGTAHYDDSIAAYYLKPLTSPYYLSGVLALLLLPGLWAIRKFGALAVLLAGWIAVQYGFVIGLAFQNIRYGLAYFPPLTILIGLGVGLLVYSVASRPVVQQRLMYFAATLLVVYAVGTTLSTASDLLSGFVANKDRDLGAVQWVETMIPEAGATVYTLDLLQTIGHYAPTLKSVQVFYETPDSMAVRLPTERPAYALFNVWTTEHQWQGKTPWRIYHWLLDQPGLTEIGSYDIYTLYRVN